MERPTNVVVQAHVPEIKTHVEPMKPAVNKIIKEEKVDKKEIKKEEKKQVIHSKPKKNEAVVYGRNLNISTKQAVAVCNFIRNKNVDFANIVG